jgi:tetratricopeptide (TPR) repeat protein
MTAVVLLCGCERMSRSLYLSGCDRDIQNSTRSIEGARDDVQRAAGYSQRGRDYSEKARYSRFFKLIPDDEYVRLFDLAMADHDRAIALDGRSAEGYFNRGRTYYDRATLEMGGKDANRWFDRGAADFQQAVVRNSGHYMAWDMLGLIHSSTGELDDAIHDFAQEMALNPAGKPRLADAYCTRGLSHFTAKRYDAAIADLEKAVETGTTADGCSCDPYNPLATLYDDAHRRDKALEVVQKARKSRRWIAPELVEKLNKRSG